MTNRWEHNETQINWHATCTHVLTFMDMMLDIRTSFHLVLFVQSLYKIQQYVLIVFLCIFVIKQQLKFCCKIVAVRTTESSKHRISYCQFYSKKVVVSTILDNLVVETRDNCIETLQGSDSISCYIFLLPVIISLACSALHLRYNIIFS